MTLTELPLTAPTLSPPTPADLIRREDRLGAHNYKPLDVVIHRAQGAWVWDTQGRRYLDGLSAYSAVNQGHCHPRIIGALTEQAQQVTLTSRAFRNDRLAEFYETVTRVLGFEAVIPMNTGAEAVETAIKLARKWAYRTRGVPENRAELIVMDGNFHGRTTTLVSFSTEAQYREGFGPFTPGFVSVPYGDVTAIEAAITPNTAGVLFEPIQGEAGVITPPEGFLRALREVCDRRGVLMIADEIQTGLGRTGHWLACDHEGVKPDVVILGKALGGGVYPVSAVLSSRGVMDLFRPGDHGSTFGGNPLAAAVAQASLQVIEDEDLPARARELGAYVRARLEAMNSPHVREIRGRGLLIGVDLHGPARPFCEALRDLGVLCKETHETTMRLAPPLVTSREDLDWALERIEQVLR
ncbi:ornithine--oxo-acid transaminase [Deinococcus soli (ex Cha et al. 2016)]|uniref:ornithine aminotransferase n=2 Tax=Deinococcus soli (ex Cha et al. 2016) TaxID=1309411 RepID=A0AAE3XBA0_9DEIO|nr:ornithine--oxo-acid transaminase [Deinococcus soli (ex Cha et al. 2016)]MDR6217906.1 ornithine--oxo-acid transaminase [Deinococcus soli (ex Cha et al. 2016)]MDR6328156.1 ornithine--oxo-acid transaminase [Deinococcus soli (ex Cha et al. 2016)]MDR6751008.1 ornithine--oxo-acid transaminase [Deinococcus soli (ex Cha et al. 2016)]